MDPLEKIATPTSFYFFQGVLPLFGQAQKIFLTWSTWFLAASLGTLSGLYWPPGDL